MKKNKNNFWGAVGKHKRLYPCSRKIGAELPRTTAAGILCNIWLYFSPLKPLFLFVCIKTIEKRLDKNQRIVYIYSVMRDKINKNEDKKMETMTIKQVVEYIKNDDTFDDFGFRGDNCNPVEIDGNKFYNSRYHGDDVEEFELDGVSCIFIAAKQDEYIESAIYAAKKYGKNVYLLRGNQVNADEEFNDPNECLIQNNVIVCTIDFGY